MIVSPRAVREFTGRKFDDFEWMKQLSKRQLLRHLGELRVPPTFKTDPWTHQLVAHYIGCCYPRFLFLLDMGLGKTKIFADLITQKQREGLRKRALVIGPRLINIASWQDDLLLHSDLEPNPISAEEIEGKRELLLNPSGDVSLIDLHGMTLALSKKGKVRKGIKWHKGLVPDEKLVRMAQKLYGFLVIDEVHKLKNMETIWHTLAAELSQAADFVYAGTGTIFNRSPLEVFGPFHLVDRGETFGETDTLFKAAFFTEHEAAFKGKELRYDTSKTRLFSSMVRHRSLRYDEDEVSDLPPRQYRRIEFTMQGEQAERYADALAGVIAAKNGDEQELKAPWLRMRYITAGYLRWNDEFGPHLIKFKHNPKLDYTVKICDEAGDSKVVICYDYTETGRMIVERLEAEGFGVEWLWGGNRDKRGVRERFLNDPRVTVLVMQSEAGGTGTDGLQRVARYMVFYESPTPPRDRRQTEKRIDRAGGVGHAYFYDLVCRRSVDAGILTSLQEGRDLYDSVMARKNFSLLGA